MKFSTGVTIALGIATVCLATNALWPGPKAQAAAAARDECIKPANGVVGQACLIKFSDGTRCVMHPGALACDFEP